MQPTEPESSTEGPRLLTEALTRTERGPAWLGRKCNVQTQTASLWKRGHARPSPENRVRIEQLLGVPRTAWLTPEERGDLPAPTTPPQVRDVMGYGGTPGQSGSAGVGGSVPGLTAHGTGDAAPPSPTTTAPRSP